MDLTDDTARDIRRIRLILDWWVIFSVLAVVVRALAWFAEKFPPVAARVRARNKGK